MDQSLLMLAGLDVVFGVLGLFGIQSVPQKFKGKSWTGTYVRGMALSELLMGVLLGALVLITRGMELNLVVTLLLVAVAVVPSLVLCIAVTKKCNEFLKNGVE